MSRFLSRYYGWFLHLSDSQLLLKRALSSISLILPTVQVLVALDHLFAFLADFPFFFRVASLSILLNSHNSLLNGNC